MPDNPFPPADRGQILSRYGRELDVLNESLNLLGQLAAGIDQKPMAGMSRIQFFVLFQFVKAVKTGQAIRHLFEGGFEEDAEMSLRVLVEQAIIVRWVCQGDSDGKARAYALYLRENRLRMLETARKFLPSVNLPESLIREIEKDGAEYHALGKDEKWRRMTGEMAELAAEGGLAQSYAVHLSGSNLIHSNPVVEASYVRSSGEHTYFNAGPSRPPDAWTPMLAAKHLLWVGEALAGVFLLRISDAFTRHHAVIDGYDSPRPERPV